MPDSDAPAKITAISFDYTGFDVTDWVGGNDKLGFADDVYEFREATKGFVGSSLFTAASDNQGNVLYTSYQTYPCREYLERDEDGQYMPGSDPKQLLDGTVYGGFTMPSKDGIVDEEPGKTDPYKCVVPFDEVPQAINPEAGFVFTANNDPAHITDDGDPDNDKWHLGGPWSSVRANTIRRELEACAADKSCDLEAMQALQANIKSRMGEEFVPYLLAAIDKARTLSQTDGDKGVDDARLVALYDNNMERFEAAEKRLADWQTAGFDTPSGVETFYMQPTDQNKVDAVATMIFNAWIGRFIGQVWHDEPMPGWRWSGSRGEVASLLRYLASRGADNPQDHTAWDADTQEAVWFDRLGTDEVERSDELMLVALAAGLDFLESDSTGPGDGGFGTTDMSQWLWGLRHQAKFESLLGDFLGSNSSFSALVDVFSIKTSTLPLADDIKSGDPRKGLEWFPRGGDQWSVDAANPGFSGTKFRHGSGPVMRMAISLKGDEVRGENIVPGGQSALTDSEFFADQAALWLGNETLPMRYYVADVVEHATAHEVYTPADAAE